MAEAVARAVSPPEQTHALGVSSSLTGRAWHYRAHDPDQARRIALTAGLSPPLAQMLAARGIAPDEAPAFLEPRLKSLMPDPHALAGMARAAERFAKAIRDGERIAVFGDYDVDGSTSAALVLGFLRALGRDAILYIPDRMTEGYGPNPKAMLALKEQGASLAVTVDCGAAAHEALTEARNVGLDVIVLDHHAVEADPPAFAHVNPNGPDDRSGFGQLSAAGVTFLFLVAVNRGLREAGWLARNGHDEPDLFRQLDLVALATIADVVPLTGINRAFVRQGLNVMEALERPGFAALANVARIAPPFTPYHLGFLFGPRINAGGRVGRCDLGARLLSCTDVLEAEALARELDTHNRERRAIEQTILEDAKAQAAMQTDAAFVLAASEGWHAGVVGIVAGRLKDAHAKPAFVVGFEGGVGRGSARSVPGVDLGAVVRAARAEGLLEAGGGHAMAAGFTLKQEKLDALAAFLADAFAGSHEAIFRATDLMADAAISAAGATRALIDDLARAGPFGAGNPEPMFVVPDVSVAFADVVGQNHVRARFAARDGARLSAIAFGAAGTALGRGLLKARGRRLHVAGRLKPDDYRGGGAVQLHLEDAANAGA